MPLDPTNYLQRSFDDAFIAKPRPRRGRPSTAMAQAAHILPLILQGWTAKEIAWHCHMSYTSIYRIKKRMTRTQTMPLDPNNYLRACDDAFLRVVDEEGTLLGCIPSPGNQDLSAVTIRDQDGRAHDLWFGLVAAVVVNLQQGELPTRLYDFTPITGLDDIVRRKLAPEPIPGNSPDIGREPQGR